MAHGQSSLALRRRTFLNNTFNTNARPKVGEPKPVVAVLSGGLILLGLVASANAQDMSKMPGMEHSQAGPAQSSAAPTEPSARPACPAIQKWNSAMGMCMPNAGAANKDQAAEQIAPPNEAIPSEQKPPASPGASNSCPDGDHFDGSMKMCMPGGAQQSSAPMIHLNQFMVYSTTSGPRGQSRATGPGMWMLMYGKDLSARNAFSVDVMGSPEQLTVGSKGTPQLLQTEHVDSMHAHDTVMALEFRDALALGDGDKQHLTFLFAPRGEAAVGPVPFMHRPSAEGNPDAPLGHALQDGFHDASTVLGLQYDHGRTKLEATAFSGQSVSWPLPMHSPDSYALRVSQDIDGHVGVGASYADALLPDDVGGAQHSQFISAWLTTSHELHGDTLKSALIWGQSRAAHESALNSFLEEAVYQHGMDKFLGRAELLQLTPQQLDLALSNGSADAKWVTAFTVGYERTVIKREHFSLFGGGSYTKDITPSEFQPAYGADPRGAKLYLRIAIDR
jgi:hypothetical protein